MKTLLLFFAFFSTSIVSSNNPKFEVQKQKNLNPLQNQASDIPIPKNYTILDEATGDLDKDGIAEKVIVFDTNSEKEKYMGTVREIHIFN